jgi:hypothetical protein
LLLVFNNVFLLLYCQTRHVLASLLPDPPSSKLLSLVSIMQATGLLGWSRRQMAEAIENGEVELWTTPIGKWFPQAEMMAKALEIWPMHIIEEALGDDADGILP